MGGGVVGSHKIVINGRHNQLTKAWFFLAGVPRCGLLTVPWLVLPLPYASTDSTASVHARREEFERMFPLFFHPAPVGFAVSRSQSGDLYDIVGTDLTDNL